jgi:monoamine oxidase
MSTQTHPIQRIIVIGAGLAGLGAARAFVERGIKVTILEARNRIGGRCHTVAGIDLGAHWIHGTDGNPITNLVHSLNIPTLFVGGDSTYTGGWESLMLYGTNGKKLSSQEKQNSILAADELLDKLDSMRRQYQAEKHSDISMAQAIDTLRSQPQAIAVDPTLVDWHLALTIRDDCAADAERLSFLWRDEGYEVYGYGDSVLLQGYGRLIEQLAEGLDIRTEQIVTKIEYGNEGVSITTNCDVFTGDVALVTLPLGVLKARTVNFDPPLPDAKLAAIDRLEMGNLTKVTMHFEQVFWQPDQYVFGCMREPIYDYPTVMINLWKTHHLPVLQLLIGGNKGRYLERCSPEELSLWAMRILRHHFGEQAHQPLRIDCTHWQDDPFSLGSYSYIPVGATPNDIETLAAPVGERLFFAGEATNHHYWGCTHGAYASGLREAARITEDTSILPARHFTENRRWRAMIMRASRFFNVVTQTTKSTEVDARVAVLANNKVFAAVPYNEMKLLALMFEPTEFAAGETICQIGDLATDVYVITAGQVAVKSAKGQQIRIMEPGDVAGEYGLFGGGTRSATLVAYTDCRLLKLDYQRFHRFLLTFPESTLVLMKQLVERLRSKDES